MEIDLVVPKYTVLLAGSRVCLVCTLLLGSRFKNCSLRIRTWDSEAFKHIRFLGFPPSQREHRRSSWPRKPRCRGRMT